MKAFPIKLMAVSICILCVLSIGFVSALNSDEASVSLFWSSQAVYQGDVISVKITFTSTCPEQLTIYGIGLHFDWMSPDGFYGRDLSNNPVSVPSYGTHIFESIAIEIPANVSTGVHSYFVGVDGVQGYSLTEFSWDSPPFTMQVQAATGKVYSVLATQFESDLNEALDANYETAEAKSLLQQAQVEYGISRTLVAEERWSEALLHIQNATNYLTEAKVAEQRIEEQKGQQQTLLVYLAIVAVAVIIVVSIILVVVRRRRKQAESFADQSFDEQTETQNFTPEE